MELGFREVNGCWDVTLGFMEDGKGCRVIQVLRFYKYDFWKLKFGMNSIARCL
jgi:hypothetical protein